VDHTITPYTREFAFVFRAGGPSFDILPGKAVRTIENSFTDSRIRGHRSNQAFREKFRWTSEGDTECTEGIKECHQWRFFGEDSNAILTDEPSGRTIKGSAAVYTRILAFDTIEKQCDPNDLTEFPPAIAGGHAESQTLSCNLGACWVRRFPCFVIRFGISWSVKHCVMQRLIRDRLLLGPQQYQPSLTVFVPSEKLIQPGTVSSTSSHLPCSREQNRRVKLPSTL